MNDSKINRNNKRVKIISILAALVLIGGGIAGYVSVRFIAHEKAQNAQINALTAQVSLLQAKLSDNSTGGEFTGKVSDGGFDYLAIGNSITQHDITDFWWGRWGMAASKEDLDYYHRVVAGIEERLGTDINTVAYNYSVWEVQGHDRTETYEFLDNYLAEGIDLVTIQLSENASDISTLEEDYVSLVNYVNQTVPNAQIIIIDDFWDDGKSEIKKRAAAETKVSFADLSDIRGDLQYQSAMGQVVFDADGKEHVIEHAGVAAHPGDEGMAVIAERVLEKIKGR